MHMTTKTAMIVPDIQVPLHDRVFVEKLTDAADYLKPDVLVFIGDLTDSTEVGRWVKGRAGEYTGALQEAFDETEQVVSAFRRSVGDDCEMVLIDSNHDSRMKEYVLANAPALSSLRSVDFATSIGLGRNHVQYVSGPYKYLPGCVAVHGHERAYSSVPGKYGLARVLEYGHNVVYGHTHTPLLVSTTVGVAGEESNRWAMNVGHAMDKLQAGYLKDGYATWCQAFGTVTYDSDFDISVPHLYQAPNGHFEIDGKVW